jgi:hypothetical protein
MKKLTLALAAATALTLAAGATQAQVWTPMVERQGLIEDQIEAGMASGELTGPEARMLRSDMYALTALEGRYRMNGLSFRERRELDRRFDELDRRLRFAMADGDGPLLASMADREADLERRIDQGLASGQLTAAEAADLRDEFEDIARIEARYRIDGISTWERADLDRRFDRLAGDIRLQRTDPERVYGYNRY